jgi:hypothetical protein
MKKFIVFFVLMLGLASVSFAQSDQGTYDNDKYGGTTNAANSPSGPVSDSNSAQ